MKIDYENNKYIVEEWDTARDLRKAIFKTISDSFILWVNNNFEATRSISWDHWMYDLYLKNSTTELEIKKKPKDYLKDLSLITLHK